MPTYKTDNRKWYTICWYSDWQGNRKQKCKRGFSTKREAQEWERQFLMQEQADVNMSFDSFVQLYEKDVKPKLRMNTWLSKASVINGKILPYFKNRRLRDITSKDVMAWQNAIRSMTDVKGNHFSTTYLKTVHNQLSCIFNHAVKFYGLAVNPAQQVGNMGSAEQHEMLFWTKDEYLKFASAMMDKPLSYYAFEVLYWCGIREGELLALTPEDFDFKNQKLRINKSYQRIRGQDIITSPKTKKSNRFIQMSDFLCEEMQDYIRMYYSLHDNDRLFPITKYYLHHEMERGCKQAGVKKIRIHDLRHSHVSLLIDMGFSALAIANRVGHEAVDITYHYAHLFPSRQTEMATKLNIERGIK